MATLVNVEKVKYSCSCKRIKPLSSLYYCKHCKPFTLKCKECVLHEIDPKYFCTNCFDNKMQKEATIQKYKCNACYNCPVCKNTLIIRASSAQKAAAVAAAAAAAAAASGGSATQTPSTPTVPAASPAAATEATTPQQPQKVFYLMCGFCRWTTRDAGIPDATTMPGGWKIQENPNGKRISQLIEAYKLIAAREKIEKDRKKYSMNKRRSFHLGATAGIGGGITGTGSPSSMHLDKYGILSPVNKRLQMQALGSQGAADGSAAQQSLEQQFKSMITPAKTVDSFAPLSEDFYTKPLNLNAVTSINQRHSNPEFQPAKSTELYPIYKPYVTKESKRCNGCEHNVLKPENNVPSIKFKLHQMAIFIIPEIRIVTVPEWKLNEPNEVILSITNRCENDLNVWLTTNPANIAEGDPEALNQNLSNFTATARVSFGENDNVPFIIDRLDNGKAQQISALKQADMNTNGFICLRRDNKVAIVCQVVPFDDKDENAGTKFQQPPRVKVVFALKHAFVETPGVDQKPVLTHQSSTSSITTTGSPGMSPSSSVQGNLSTPTTAQPNRDPLTHRIFLDLGPLRAQDGLKVVPKPRYIDDCFVLSS